MKKITSVSQLTQSVQVKRKFRIFSPASKTKRLDMMVYLLLYFAKTIIFFSIILCRLCNLSIQTGKFPEKNSY